jgi:hypothetical protein
MALELRFARPGFDSMLEEAVQAVSGDQHESTAAPRWLRYVPRVGDAEALALTTPIKSTSCHGIVLPKKLLWLAYRFRAIDDSRSDIGVTGNTG